MERRLMQYNAKLTKNLSLMLKPSRIVNADAAVALLLKPMNRDFKILLVKRIENPSDPWSGQMAFPGGKRDPKDRSIKQTVIREILEETNVDVTRCCRFLGVLENIRSTVRPELSVAPFIILLEDEPTIVLNTELEEYFWVSARKLQKSRGTARLPLGEVPAYLIDGHVIWGLTYRIIEKFAQILEQAAKSPAS